MKIRVRLTEVWKPVVGYEDCYAVSNHGRIKRTKKGKGTTVGRILKLRLRKNGYLDVLLCKDGKKKSYLVHCLVLEAFAGPCPPGHECNHKCKSGNKTKNYLWNLEWVTHSENQRHMVDVLNKCVGVNNSAYGKFGKDHNRSKKYILTSPDGLVIKVHGLRKFCRENSLDQGAMVAVAKRHWSHHKGWKCIYA